MTSDVKIPPYCYGYMPRGEYRKFKSDRQWKWRFNRERFRHRRNRE